MKKRVVSLLLALVVLCMGVMMSACRVADKELTPEEISVADVIDEAVKKTQALDSMSVVMKIEMSMDMEGVSVLVPITAKINAKDMKSDKAVMSMAMTMSMMGQELAIDMYQEGEWAYIVMDDFKYKTGTSELESELDYANSMEDMLKEIPKELLKDVELVKAEDGSQTATILLSGEKFIEIYSELIESMNSDTGIDIAELQISDAVVKITVADDYVKVYDVAFTMGMTVEGISSTTQAKASLTFENPGQPVVVTPPEGYLNFEEISMGDSEF